MAGEGTSEGIEKTLHTLGPSFSTSSCRPKTSSKRRTMGRHLAAKTPGLSGPGIFYTKQQWTKHNSCLLSNPTTCNNCSQDFPTRQRVPGKPLGPFGP